MKRRKIHPKRLSWSLISLLLPTCLLSAQSVGIGIENPNPNAVLELVSTDKNQGLLIPKMTTVERMASQFMSKLSTEENGLLVFDSDENEFYYWVEGSWHSLSNSVTLTSGNGIFINGSEITNTGDLDATNELQALQFNSGQITLSSDPDATIIDLSSYDTNVSDDFDGDFNNLGNIPAGLADGDDNTQLSDSDIAAFGYIKNADDADADPNNEIQDLNLSGNTLFLSNSTSTVDLAPFSGTNTDNQMLSLLGPDLSISGGNSIDISSIDTDTQLSDSDISNEIELPDQNGNGGKFLSTDGTSASWISSPSPWVSDGSIIYSLTPTKVGIGTNIGSGTINVAGDERFSIDVSNFFNENTSSTTVGFRYTGPNGFFGAAATGPHDYGLHIRFEDKNYLSANLGIGTDDPSQKLDVEGNVEINGTIISPPNSPILSFNNTTGSILTVPDNTRVVRIENSLNSPSSLPSITQITPGIDGQELIIINVDTSPTSTINFVRSSSTSSNKFYTNADSISFSFGDVLTFIYSEDLQAWLMVSHSQNSSFGVFN